MRRTTFVIASLMLLTTIALAKDATYDFDRTVTFSKYKTYAWTAGTSVGDQLNDKRIVNAIDSQLASKGLKKVTDTANPNMLVAYHASFDKEIEINATSTVWGPLRLGVRTGSARTTQIVVGTLVLDMMDPATKIVIWRGTASRELDPKASPDKRDKNISRAAGKLLENYPPKAK
jgi:uncharacterized protein DUF4136